MKLIYCASFNFSNKLAHRAQIHAMAKEFAKRLGNNFIMGVNGINQDDENINIVCFHCQKSYRLAWKYLKYIKENKIDYIYCREPWLLFFMLLYKRFIRLNAVFIYEIHAFEEHNLRQKLVNRIIFSNVEKFIFITKSLLDIFLRKYPAIKEKSLIEPDAVDLEIFNLHLTKKEARDKLGLPENALILGYMGRFKTMGMDKGINDILRAVKLLARSQTLFIAVGGSDKDVLYYKEMAREFKIEDRVMLLGSHTQAELALYQQACDILLMPFPFTEHYAYYMSPLKMFEYMAGGRPIIATDLPTIREVLNEKNSVLIKPDSQQELAGAILKIAQGGDYGRSLAEQALRDVQEYTWGKRAGRILKHIANGMGRAG